jgi:hypothetical protein
MHKTIILHTRNACASFLLLLLLLLLSKTDAPTLLLLLLLFLHNRNACGIGLHTLCCCLLLSSLELGLNKTVIITKEVAEDRKKKKHLSQWYQTRVNEFV